MDILKEREFRYANDTINQARRDLAALGAFGWPPSEAQRIIDQYGQTMQKFGANQSAITHLRPEPGKDHEKALTELLKAEAYLLETLKSLSEAAAEAVQLERLAFFEGREEHVKPYLDEIARADQQAEAAIRDLAGAMQRRFRAMQGDFELRAFLNGIDSTGYGEPQFRLPKPFSKTIKQTWMSYAEVYLSRILEVLRGSEFTAPEHIAPEVFRLPGGERE